MRLLEALGATNVRVRAQNFEHDRDKRAAVRKRSEGLSVADARHLGGFPVFVDHAPVKQLRPYGLAVNVRSGDVQITEPAVVGTTPSYLGVMGFTLREGRFLTEEDERGYSRVCVIEEKVRRQVWPTGSVVGKRLFIDNEPYEVVGALREKHTGEEKFELASEPSAEEAGRGPETEIEGLWKKVVAEQQLNERIYIPLSCALARTTQSLVASELDEVVFKARSVDDLPVAKDVIIRHLTQAHSMSDLPPTERDFRVEVPMDLIRQAQENQRIFNAVIGATAGISLLVGGIGIMNIMLANVTERRREIGIRRAVGATERDVLRQFVVEAVLICLFGGLAGLLAGLVMSLLVSWLAGYSTAIALWGVAVALGVSVADGLAFGTYPAYKAAKLDPIEALRYE
jgi:putative ABC transport system permease protein